jgi:hypothetical protein
VDDLRKLFATDPDFSLSVFDKQMYASDFFTLDARKVELLGLDCFIEQLTMLTRTRTGIKPRQLTGETKPRVSAQVSVAVSRYRGIAVSQYRGIAVVVRYT